jgi:hypothetical protein
MISPPCQALRDYTAWVAVELLTLQPTGCVGLTIPKADLDLGHNGP